MVIWKYDLLSAIENLMFYCLNEWSSFIVIVYIKINVYVNWKYNYFNHLDVHDSFPLNMRLKIVDSFWEGNGIRS